MSKVRYFVAGAANRNGRILILRPEDIETEPCHGSQIEGPYYHMGSYGLIPVNHSAIYDDPQSARKAAEELIAKKLDQTQRRLDRLKAIRGVRIWDYYGQSEVE